MPTEAVAQPSAESMIETDVIDLRSDTLTKPTAAMRAAMASAEVGDDVYGEDPTIQRLEARAAAIFEREAALFVPSGTMGNQIGLRLHTEHGQEIICETRSHIVEWEMAMIAAFSGCMPRTVPAARGILTWREIRPAIAPPIYYRAQTGLISLENTHNMHGGTVMPLAVLEEIWHEAAALHLPVHLDGARVFNAAAALNLPVATITRGFATVSFCLSKGLGAPVGSILTGSRELIDRGRAFRKALGGGMRQAGILAAAGLVALEQMPERHAPDFLYEDHANALLLAEAIAPVPGVSIDLEAFRAGQMTNIVIVDLENEGDASALVQRLKARGVLSTTTGPHSVRLVTHRDVDRAACQRAAAIVSEVLAG